MKSFIISMTVTIILISGIFILNQGNATDLQENSVGNGEIAGDRQIIEIRAKGGYSPKITLAKADIPTTLQMETKGTFDCTSVLNIPGLNYRGYLKPSGTTEIEIPPQKSGTVLQGFCGMGMYNFQIKFS